MYFIGCLLYVTLSAYRLYGNFGKKFPSNGTGIFLGTKNRNGIELYHLQNTGQFFAFSRLEACTGNPNNGTKNFRLFGKNRKKVRPRKVLLFPENSYRDEPFHLNCLRNFLVFHTNGKRSLSKLNLIRNPGMFCLWNSESLGYGIPNTAQRIWNPANDWNPEYKFH